MTVLRSSALPMHVTVPTPEQIEAARRETAARGADDISNYARVTTPAHATYADQPTEDLSGMSTHQRAMNMREKMRAVLANGDNNDAAINGR